MQLRSSELMLIWIQFTAVHTCCSFTSSAAVPARCIIMLLSLNCDYRVPVCFNTPFDCKHLLCVCRGRGDVLPLRMEGLCHHPLLFLHRHHPPCSGAGVSPGCKYSVTVARCFSHTQMSFYTAVILDIFGANQRENRNFLKRNAQFNSSIYLVMVA